jgi:hypothetical protein
MDIQRKGAVKTHPSIADAVRVDFRDTIHYKMSAKILEPAQVALENPNGVVCPYLVLLRGMADGWPSSKCPSVTSEEFVNVLKQIGAVEGDHLSKIIEAALDRLQGCISGGFVPDWLEFRVKDDNLVK